MIYLYHDPRSPLLKKLSGNQTFSNLSIEIISKVEEIVISSSETQVHKNEKTQVSSLEKKTV